MKLGPRQNIHHTCYFYLHCIGTGFPQCKTSNPLVYSLNLGVDTFDKKTEVYCYIIVKHSPFRRGKPLPTFFKQPTQMTCRVKITNGKYTGVHVLQGWSLLNPSLYKLEKFRRNDPIPQTTTEIRLQLFSVILKMSLPTTLIKVPNFSIYRRDSQSTPLSVQ